MASNSDRAEPHAPLRNTDLLPELERVLATQPRDLTAKGVRSVSLVGSHARGTAKPESDIDLLLDLAPDATFGLIELFQLKDTFGEALSRKVDVGSRAPSAPMSKRT